MLRREAIVDRQPRHAGPGQGLEEGARGLRPIPARPAAAVHEDRGRERPATRRDAGIEPQRLAARARVLHVRGEARRRGAPRLLLDRGRRGPCRHDPGDDAALGRGLPAVRAAEDVLDGEQAPLLGGEPVRPRDASVSCGARPRAPPLAVAHRRLAQGPVPVVPAFRPHDVGHLGVEERHAREGPPGPPQPRLHPRLPGDAAPAEDEAVALLLRCRGRGEVAVPPRVDPAALEEGRGPAEDEVDAPRDEAVLEVLPAAVEQDRVLPPHEPAAAEGGAVAVHAHGERLPPLGPRGVLEGQVLRREVVRVDLRGRRAEGADGSSVGPREEGVEVVRDDRPLGVLSHQGEEALLPLDVEALAVGSRLDVDDPGPLATRRGSGEDGRLERLELAGAVRGHHGVGVRRPALRVRGLGQDDPGDPQRRHHRPRGQRQPSSHGRLRRHSIEPGGDRCVAEARARPCHPEEPRLEALSFRGASSRRATRNPPSRRR